MRANGRYQWFYLHPHVHTCTKGSSGLLYDPLSGHTLEYTDEPAVTELVARLDGPDNLRVVDYADVSIAHPAVADRKRLGGPFPCRCVVAENRRGGRPQGFRTRNQGGGKPYNDGDDGSFHAGTLRCGGSSRPPHTVQDDGRDPSPCQTCRRAHSPSRSRR